MRKELLEQYGKELISAIACLTNGIGKTSAGYLAEHFGLLPDFLNTKTTELQQLLNGKGQQVFTDDKIQKLLITVKEYSVLTTIPICEAWVYFLAKNFIQNQIRLLESLHIETLDINPLLVKALHLKSSEEIIRFNLYQSVTRSAVTSWGTTVEAMVKYSGCELEEIKIGQRGRKPDLKKIKDGKDNYLQIKSGPNTMNVDMIESLNKVIQEIEKLGANAFLGMTYGTRDRISAQIRGNLTDVDKKTKIGRELWDFISESTNYHLKVISALDLATKNELKISFTDLIDKKIKECVKQWNEVHRDSEVNKILERYI